MPASMQVVYRVTRVIGLWPWARAARLWWLGWLSQQMHVTDLRQQEILLEHFALERLP